MIRKVLSGCLAVLVLAGLVGSQSAVGEEYGLKTEVLSSGMDWDTLPKNKEAARLIDEVSDKLGLVRRPHRLEFVASDQLAHLAAVGRPAVSHWHDGSLVITQAPRSMGVMEFVCNGDPTNRSFYSASSSPNEQVEIIKHVAGHNDFGANSKFALARQGVDPIRAAAKMDELIERAERQYDSEEVSQFFQYLLTVADGQDYANGGYVKPSEFVRPDADETQLEKLLKAPPQSNNSKFKSDGFDGLFSALGASRVMPAVNPKKVAVHPATPTPHELQFLVRNLPEGYPQWKKDMIALMEEMEAPHPEVVASKIMNEGWAEFVMYLIQPYLPFTKDDAYFLEAGYLRSLVEPAKMSNPYWVGRQAWTNLYFKFFREAKVDPKTLSNEQRVPYDQAFVKLAHNLMNTIGDYEFLKLALNDVDWIRKHHLYLYRTANWEEQDREMDPPRGYNPMRDGPIEQKRVVSTNPARVAQWMAKKLADRSLQFPTVLLENVSATGRNVYSMRHEVVEKIPLKRSSAVQAMFVRSQIMQRPVSLKTIALSSWVKLPPKRVGWNMQEVPDPEFEDYTDYVLEAKAHTEDGKVLQGSLFDFFASEAFGAVMARDSGRSLPEFVIPTRVEVSPDGKVQAFLLYASGEFKPKKDSLEEWPNEKLNTRLTAFYQRYLDSFREELEGSFSEEFEDAQNERFGQFISKVANQVVQSNYSQLTHVLSSHGAVQKYHQMIERRLASAMKRALSGKTRLKRTSKGMRLKVLPSIPSFELDQEAARFMEAKNEKERLERTATLGHVVRKASLSVFSSVRGAFGLAVPANSLEREQERSDWKWGIQVKDLRSETIGSGDSTPSEGGNVWGPQEPPPQDQSGDDEGEGEGGEGQSEGGKEPGEGGGGADPTEIDIPLELYGEFLAEQVELPNLKPKAGQTEIMDTERDSYQYSQRGEVMWDKVMPKILALGKLSQKRDGVQSYQETRRQMMVRGIKLTNPTDWVTPAREEIPEPDTNAAVAFWMDMTGSMMGKPIEMAKLFTFNLKALLSSKYKNLKFIYIGFSDTAKLYDTEEAFFKGFFGGGTDYAVGIKKTQEEMAQFDPSQYDRYAFGIGDLEDGNESQSIPALKELAQEMDYSAVVQTYIDGMNSPAPGFLKTVTDLASDKENHFGYGKLTPGQAGSLEALRQILGSDKK